MTMISRLTVDRHVVDGPLVVLLRYIRRSRNRTRVLPTLKELLFRLKWQQMHRSERKLFCEVPQCVEH